MILIQQAQLQSYIYHFNITLQHTSWIQHMLV